MFNVDGWEVVRGFVGPEVRDVATQYALHDEGNGVRAGDAQVPDSHAKYADPLMESLLVAFHEQMETVTGLTLFPTYAYYRVYRTGMSLAPHKDRPSCEISVSVCFGHSYSTIDGVWPLFMGTTPAVLRPGDGVVYRGYELEHSRPALTIPDAWQVQGFFHYVDVFGPYREWMFDKRPRLGYQKGA